MDTTFSQTYRIGISQVDTTRKLKLSALEAMFMETGSFHCEQAGLGIEDTKRMGITWVITKMRMEINRLPKVWETVTVETWPLEKGKITFDRDYVLMSENNEVLVRATSRWCLINEKTRTPVPKVMVKHTQPNAFAVPQFDSAFLVVEPVENKGKQHNILYSDLDFNQHITNTKYFDIALDTLKKDEIEGLDIGAVQMNFVAEAPYDSKLFVAKKQTKNQLIFCGRNQNNDVVFSLLMILKPKID